MSAYRRRKKKRRSFDACGSPSCDCDVCGCDPCFMFIPLLRTVPATLTPLNTPSAPGRLGLAAIRGSGG